MTFIRRLAADPNAVFAAELILGEILATTVEHAPGLVEVHMDWSDEKPVVTVRDSGPGVGEIDTDLPPDVFTEGGRGLFLVRTLAESVSVARLDGLGTEIRVVLPIIRGRARTRHPLRS